MEELLRMEHISKRFGSFYANKDISFDLRKGEVHTLFGENGAGKSTLMNILFGLYQPTSGEIFLNGEKVKIRSAAEAVKLKIGMVHQHFMLIEAMTVFENIILGDNQTQSPFIKREEAEKKIRAISEKYSLSVDLDKKITEISVGEQQRVEIIKALYRDANLLILDEPTAVLTDIEVQSLFQIINKFIADDKSVIFISHKMREVMDISHRITVLRGGEKIVTLNKGDVTVEELASLMIGREFKELHFDKTNPETDCVLKLNSVSLNKESKRSGLNNIDLHIKSGEILGVAGVDGNGQSQLVQVATGVSAPDEGEILINGEKITKFTPQEFIARKVAHIPEDRNRMGLVGGLSVSENILLKAMDSPEVSKHHGKYINKEAVSLIADGLRDKYDIRCQSVQQVVKDLSGGNQQKVILARELEMKPSLLVASHPTRGLDVGATEFIHKSMVEARDAGCAILLVSADFDEILNLSDRIIVMFEGKIMGEFPGVDPPIKEIGMAISGRRIDQ